MGETADALRSDIESRRQEMADDIDELEQRARAMTDWRHQISERPMAALGVAAVGGLLLGILTGGSDDDDRRDERRQFAGPMAFQSTGFQSDHRPDGSNGGGMAGWVTGQRGPSQATQVGKDRAATKFDEIRGALMGLAAARAEEFLREAVPGFDHEVRKVQQNSQRDEQDDKSVSDDARSRATTGAWREDQV